MNHVFGVDLGIHKLAVAIFAAEGSSYAMHASSVLDLSDRDLSRELELYGLGKFIENLSKSWEPEHVFIEETLVGNNTKYSIQLAETKGAVRSGLAMSGTDVRMVNNMMWKKQVVGHGN